MNWNEEYHGYRYYCISYILPISKLQSLNVNFVKDLNEELKRSIDRYIISVVLVMYDFNSSIRDKYTKTA